MEGSIAAASPFFSEFELESDPFLRDAEQNRFVQLYGTRQPLMVFGDDKTRVETLVSVGIFVIVVLCSTFLPPWDLPWVAALVWFFIQFLLKPLIRRPVRQWLGKAETDTLHAVLTYPSNQSLRQQHWNQGLTAREALQALYIQDRANRMSSGVFYTLMCTAAAFVGFVEFILARQFTLGLIAVFAATLFLFYALARLFKAMGPASALSRSVLPFLTTISSEEECQQFVVGSTFEQGRRLKRILRDALKALLVLGLVPLILGLILAPSSNSEPREIFPGLSLELTWVFASYLMLYAWLCLVFASIFQGDAMYRIGALLDESNPIYERFRKASQRGQEPTA